nr:hypothetical protein [Oryza sativa Japonica Group]BAD17496.1 hypothetical protein [Oryza sativa Japonica Group]
MAKKKSDAKPREGLHKPPEVILKVNIGASFDIVSSTEGTGAVIRDSQGTFLAGSCRYLSHIADAAMAEAYALRDGLILA